MDGKQTLGFGSTMTIESTGLRSGHRTPLLLENYLYVVCELMKEFQNQTTKCSSTETIRLIEHLEAIACH